MLRTIIIDDELIGVNALKVLIEKHIKEVKVIATATEPEKGIEYIEDYRPDIVFLDISMPGMNGFELLDHLKYKDFKLVFTTAHEEYALKAIKNRAFDYLLKPIDLEELKRTVNIIAQNSVNENNTHKASLNLIEIPVKDGIVFIKSHDIIRIEAAGSYTVFYLENNVKHTVSKNLKECEPLLDLSFFYRCHASHIINLKKVVKMVNSNGLYAQMCDGSMPDISKKSREAFLEKLKTI